ncbi:small ribosomal subunit Rsm22 family protein [Oleiharenicola sp. Vm1]|uniref:small ribosomal subunit Rsm22 family protein n=1 Tax=Oleiharenicola sp. Vm1 TaxID=3398393 RepID=UPI0039F49ECA
MDLTSLDWEVLDRLRETFLTDARAAGPYWHTITDLEAYDLTYAERIGWKWDAVLRELRLRRWSAPANATVFDWGCGSGVAGRRVAAFLGLGQVARLVLHDHSPLAVDFALHRAQQRLPALAVERASYRFLQEGTIDVLVVSHVLNELDETGRAELAGLLARAQTVLWVEPGTHEVSRALAGWRERLRADGLPTVAPCPHDAPCGLLAPGRERDWCHFFAAPPPEIFANSEWVRFGQRAGIDLRSLPYSFLVLDRRAAPPPADASRILGEPRVYKGYAKIFNCSARGVEELMLQQRADKDLFKSLKRASGPLVYRWTRDGDRINAAERLLS